MIQDFVLILLFVFLSSSKRIVSFHINWQKCPVYTNLRTPYKNIFFFKLEPIYLYGQQTFDGQSVGDINSECSVVKLPLDYFNASSTETVPIFIKRFLKKGDGDKSKNILWVFPHYEGGSSDKLENLMIKFSRELQNFDIYYVDHRGVGRSGRIGCSESGAETEGSIEGIEISKDEIRGCLKQFKNEDFNGKNNNRYFSTTYFAHDILSIIDRINKENDYNHHMFGVGYGGYVISRILQVDKKNSVKSVILDSSFSQTANEDVERYTVDNWNPTISKIGLKFMEHCMNNSFCVEKINHYKKITGKINEIGAKNYVEKVLSLVFDERNSICEKAKKHFHSKLVLKKLLGSMLFHTHFRELIPSLLYRLVRCSDDKDYGVFSRIDKKIVYEGEKRLSRIPFDSIITGLHLIYNELWTNPIQQDPLDVLNLRLNQSAFVLLDNSIGEFVKEWPIYIDKDEHFRKSFETNHTHVLLISGSLDPITPYEFSMAQYENIKTTKSATKKLIRFPYSTRFVTINSPLSSDVNANCGYDVILSFLADPLKIDTKCLSLLRGINFQGDKMYSKEFYGCESAWECDYIERSKDITVPLNFFIAVEGVTIIFFLLIISGLLYWFVTKNQIKKMIKKKEKVDEVVEEQEKYRLLEEDEGECEMEMNLKLRKDEEENFKLIKSNE